MIGELARKTQTHYGLSSKEMCAIAGISPQHWSEFRRGKTDLSSGRLWAALLAMEEMAPGAGRLFCNLLAEALTGNNEAAFTVGEQLEKLIACADREEMAIAMVAMGKRWSELAAIGDLSHGLGDCSQDIIRSEELIY